MLFRITGHSYTKISLETWLGFFVQILSLVHVNHLLHEFTSECMSIGLCYKALCLRSISTKGQHIFYANKIKIDQQVLRLLFGKTSTKDMGYRIYIKSIHQGSANPYCTRTLLGAYLFQKSIGMLFVDILLSVVGHVHERWLKLHQGSNSFQKFL